MRGGDVAFPLSSKATASRFLFPSQPFSRRRHIVNTAEIPKLSDKQSVMVFLQLDADDCPAEMSESLSRRQRAMMIARVHVEHRSRRFEVRFAIERRHRPEIFAVQPAYCHRYIDPSRIKTPAN